MLLFDYKTGKEITKLNGNSSGVPHQIRFKTGGTVYSYNTKTGHFTKLGKQGGSYYSLSTGLFALGP